MQIRLGITDDHLLVINGIRAMLADAPYIEIIFAENTGHALLERLTATSIDVLLLDIQLPDSSGIDLCKLVKKQDKNIQIIGLTNFGETHYVKQMMRNGASGYLIKNTDPHTLIEAIDTVYRGEQFLDPQIKKALLEETLTGKKSGFMEVILTKRETEILALIAQELSNQEIADQLFISLRTVETHRLNLTQKLGAKNTASLVKEAYKRGLI
jgi:DNA-binding NarL/FixJ family response regulator